MTLLPTDVPPAAVGSARLLAGVAHGRRADLAVHRAVHGPQRYVDQGALVACADLLRGSHDFTAFTPTQTEHVRFERDILAAEWQEKQALLGSGRLLELWIEADAFMRNMVRVLVGTMLEVGSGRRSLHDFTSLLEGAPREQAGETVDPHGLHLASVTY